MGEYSLMIMTTSLWIFKLQEVNGSFLRFSTRAVLGGLNTDFCPHHHRHLVSSDGQSVNFKKLSVFGGVGDVQ